MKTSYVCIECNTLYINRIFILQQFDLTLITYGAQEFEYSVYFNIALNAVLTSFQLRLRIAMLYTMTQNDNDPASHIGLKRLIIMAIYNKNYVMVYLQDNSCRFL